MEQTNFDPSSIATSQDFDEYAIGAADFDVTNIGGYPVRKIEVVAGTGTVKIKTRKADRDGVYRTWSAVAAGSKLEAIIFKVAGTTNGSSAGLTLRIYK